MQVNNVLVRRRLSGVNLMKENVEILLVENTVALAEPWSVGVGNSYLEISEKLDVEVFESVYTIAMTQIFHLVYRGGRKGQCLFALTSKMTFVISIMAMETPRHFVEP